MIILGDIGYLLYNEMVENMQLLGSTKKILDNVYVLNLEKEGSYEEVRNKIAGVNMGYCIVISLDKLKAAWHLTPENSEYLLSLFSTEHE